MKTKQNLILSLMLLTNISVANTSSTLQGQVNDIESFVDNMLASIQQRTVLPQEINQDDFMRARENLMVKMQTATNNYKSCIASLAGTIGTDLGGIEQEIANLTALYSRTHAPEINRLLTRQLDNKESFLANVSERHSDAYQNCLKKLLTIDDHIKLITDLVPADAQLQNRWLRMIPVVGWVGLLEIRVDSQNRNPTRNIGFMPADFLGNRFNCEFHDYDYHGQEQPRHYCDRFRPAARRYMRQVALHHARPMFQDCESDVCRALLSTEYINWLEMAYDLNRDLEVLDGKKLQSLELPRKRKFMKKIRTAFEHLI